MPNVKKTAGKRGPTKRKLAEEFLPGEVFTDMFKKTWKLGPVIGKGGFGCLYLADVNSSKSVTSDASYVIKVEPSDNGPLFTELSFYTRAAKPELIKKWISSHKLKYLGVPKYWGSGMHQKNGKSYRFMVMDRFGKDLQKVFEEQGKQFTRKTVLQLGLRILDVLEYVHEHEYVHGDIKASNLLLGYKAPHQNGQKVDLHMFLMSAFRSFSELGLWSEMLGVEDQNIWRATFCSLLVQPIIPASGIGLF
ncbi:Serine/threonine-protein kinase VRK1 [Varanus komodoensis]|nr:Serine/threonine-protein kinase VRK1 [Varanus komodoensis]